MPAWGLHHRWGYVERAEPDCDLTVECAEQRGSAGRTEVSRDGRILPARRGAKDRHVVDSPDAARGERRAAHLAAGVGGGENPRVNGAESVARPTSSSDGASPGSVGVAGRGT